MTLMPSLSFARSFSSVPKAKAIFESLRLETGKSFEKRSKTTLSLKNAQLEISIIADDAHALGVSKASYTKLIDYLDQLETKGA